MSNQLIETIISEDAVLRNRSINLLLQDKNKEDLLKSASELEFFRRSSDNLYHKVRASLFLFVIYRYYLAKNNVMRQGQINFEAVKASCKRDFERAINLYLEEIYDGGEQNGTIFSAIADAYYKLSFKYLLDQVRLSISQCSENYNLYNIREIEDYPFSVREELTVKDDVSGLYPIGVDASPVRLDPSHSGWSDIFFLGMDYPEGAKVINLSVDLKIHGSEGPPLPPCECYCRYTDEPVISLVSIDLNASKKIYDLHELFNFGNDYLSLLKAGVVASGVVPPSLENSEVPLRAILQKLLNKPGGIEVVTKVNGIPKGSRLAVSTTLLATIITRLMRFSGQIKDETGGLRDADRRIVASRAILGEWLGGSGGGWQDSGGIWPGIKIITGMFAEKGRPEFGVSRGCLLPEHNVFTREDIPEDIERKILGSLVLVHGGISQDVGPVLEMVTEKYLLKYEKEWNARLKGILLFDKIVEALKAGDMKKLGGLTTRDWEEAIQPIIPWVNNAFTKNLIEKLQEEFGDNFWGFLMLGGMSGGGMAFVVNPKVRDLFKDRAAEIMSELHQIYRLSYPFIIGPVVYDFKLNHNGIVSRILTGKNAIMPFIGSEPVFPPSGGKTETEGLNEASIKKLYGFDPGPHEEMKSLLKKGLIGVSLNRMPSACKLEDVLYDEILHFEDEESPFHLQPSAASQTRRQYYSTGTDALRKNEAAVVTFAGGMGSRWTNGAAVVKAINPFIMIEGDYRTFIELHLAKSRKTGELSGHQIQHVFTTSYLTHGAIADYLDHFAYFGFKDRVYLSPSQTIGRRVYPTEKDLRFFWQEQLQQKLDINAQKVQDDARNALIEWVKSRGEGEDYRENKPVLRFNPPGHWHEVPNLIKNGVLAGMLRDNPGLRYLLCHNIDTVGAYIEPSILGAHITNGDCLTFEVTPRSIEDAGGGLAKIDGHIQLIEGPALPREEDEYKLSYYNTLTNWITIDNLLGYFGIDRNDVIEAARNPQKQHELRNTIYNVEKKMPVYVTIKNVKHIWGNGQEDTYPVAQFEKLWGDMSALKDLKVGYVSVSRFRGQQLKEPSLLDMWANNGSLEYVKSKCAF